MSKKTIEGKVAETLLQEKLDVAVGTRFYTVPRPTLGTLTMASKYIATLPDFKSDRTAEVLGECAHGEKVARILSILILGSKRINMPGILRFLPFRRNVGRMTRTLLDNATNSQLWSAFTQILSMSELDDFFALTTFLREVNLLAARKVEKTETTASGQ